MSPNGWFWVGACAGASIVAAVIVYRLRSRA